MKRAVSVFLGMFALLAVTALTANAQMSVTINTSNPTPTAGGAAFSYTIVATNGTASPVFFQLNDALPPSVVLANGTINVVGSSGGQASCIGPPVGTNGVVTCTNPTFSANGQITITLVCQVVANTASGVRTNTVNVFPQGVPSSASIQQNIQVDAPLSISKTATAQTVLGGLIGYNITLSNGGSSTALNATITDTLPASTSFQAVFGTGAFGGTCAFRPATNQVTCQAISVPTGQHELTIVVRASTDQSSPASVQNSVQITTAGTGTISVASAQASTTVVH